MGRGEYGLSSIGNDAESKEAFHKRVAALDAAIYRTHANFLAQHYAVEWSRFTTGHWLPFFTAWSALRSDLLTKGPDRADEFKSLLDWYNRLVAIAMASGIHP